MISVNYIITVRKTITDIIANLSITNLLCNLLLCILEENNLHYFHMTWFKYLPISFFFV